MSEPVPTAAPPSTDFRQALNITVQNCCHAYNKAVLAERAKGAREYDAQRKGVEAFRNAMPHLSSQANIRGFIACVAHGMLIEILRKQDGAKLLYAAQIALSAVPRETIPYPRYTKDRR